MFPQLRKSIAMALLAQHRALLPTPDRLDHPLGPGGTQGTPVPLEPRLGGHRCGKAKGPKVL